MKSPVVTSVSPKFTLAEFGVQPMLSQCLENNPQMILMLLLKLMHEIHECRWSIRQSERHHCELEMPIQRSKRCLGLWCHGVALHLRPSLPLESGTSKSFLKIDRKNKALEIFFFDVKGQSMLQPQSILRIS